MSRTFRKKLIQFDLPEKFFRHIKDIKCKYQTMSVDDGCSRGKCSNKVKINGKTVIFCSWGRDLKSAGKKFVKKMNHRASRIISAKVKITDFSEISTQEV